MESEKRKSSALARAASAAARADFGGLRAAASLATLRASSSWAHASVRARIGVVGALLIAVVMLFGAVGGGESGGFLRGRMPLFGARRADARQGDPIALLPWGRVAEVSEAAITVDSQPGEVGTDSLSVRGATILVTTAERERDLFGGAMFDIEWKSAQGALDDSNMGSAASAATRARALALPPLPHVATHAILDVTARDVVLNGEGAPLRRADGRTVPSGPC
jgi:hypothetical protein